MSIGINNDADKTISMDTLGRLWYKSLDFLRPGSDFKKLRMAVEFAGMEMDEISLKQLECIIDAFDQVGIEPAYAEYKVTPNSIMNLYDKDNEIYTNYHLEIATKTELIIDEDVTTDEVGAYHLDSRLPAGIYYVTITDCADSSREKSFVMVVNDNVDDDLVTDYSEQWDVYTDFYSNKKTGKTVNKEVVLVLDTSGSMDGTPISQVRDSSHRFVAEVLKENPTTPISIITYADNMSVLIRQSNDLDELDRTIDTITSGGQTNIYAGLTEAETIISSSNADQKMIILMSDGMPTEGQKEEDSYETALISLSNQIKTDKKVLIYTLGFFTALNGDELNAGINLMSQIGSTGYYYNINENGIEGVFADMASLVNGSQYIEVTIACPVEVSVTRNGETLNSAEDDRTVRTSFGSLTFVGSDEDQSKVLRLLNDAEYDICITGTGEGTMDYSVSYPNKKGKYTDTRSFEEIPITEKTLILSNTDQGLHTELKVDTNGNGSFDRTYSAWRNTSGHKSIGNLFYMLAFTGICILLWIIQQIRIMFERFMTNRRCPVCSKKIGKNVQVCPDDGTEIVKRSLLPQHDPGWKRQSKAAIVAKLIVIGLCISLIGVETAINQSAAKEAFHQIRAQNYRIGQVLYETAVKDSVIGKRYFEFEIEHCMDKVAQAHNEERCTDRDAQEFFDVVSELGLDNISSTAEQNSVEIKNKKGKV